MLGADWPPPADAGRIAETPKLFLAGADDQIVTVHEVRSLADQYARARLEVVRGGHLEGIKVDETAYLQLVSAFLEAVEDEPNGGRES